MMQRQNLDTFVILKGNQLKREHLPVSAGLPSSAGLYRSRSFGGEGLQGDSVDGKFLTDLLSEPRRSRASAGTRKPIITRSYATQSNKTAPSLALLDTSSSHLNSNTHKKNRSKSVKALPGSYRKTIAISGMAASAPNLKKLSSSTTTDTVTAEQRRARSLQALADTQKQLMQHKKSATRVSLNKALDNLDLQEGRTKTPYSTVSLLYLYICNYLSCCSFSPFTHLLTSPIPPPQIGSTQSMMTTTATMKDRKRVQSVKRNSDAELIKLQAIQDEKKRVAERSAFLICRAQFVGMNSIVRSLEEAKWKKSSSQQSHSYEV